jgi:hypothetical protein
VSVITIYIWNIIPTPKILNPFDTHLSIVDDFPVFYFRSPGKGHKTRFFFNISLLFALDVYYIRFSLLEKRVRFQLPGTFCMLSYNQLIRSLREAFDNVCRAFFRWLSNNVMCLKAFSRMSEELDLH